MGKAETQDTLLPELLIKLTEPNLNGRVGHSYLVADFPRKENTFREVKQNIHGCFVGGPNLFTKTGYVIVLTRETIT